MAYIEPKINWIAGDVPAASDLNRIEGNIEANNALILSSVDSLTNDAIVFSGLKTFNDNIKVDTIDDVLGNGILIEGVTIKNGVITGALWGA